MKSQKLFIITSLIFMLFIVGCSDDDGMGSGPEVINKRLSSITYTDAGQILYSVNVQYNASNQIDSVKFISPTGVVVRQSAVSYQGNTITSESSELFTTGWSVFSRTVTTVNADDKITKVVEEYIDNGDVTSRYTEEFTYDGSEMTNFLYTTDYEPDGTIDRSNAGTIERANGEITSIREDINSFEEYTYINEFMFANGVPIMHTASSNLGSSDGSFILKNEYDWMYMDNRLKEVFIKEYDLDTSVDPPVNVLEDEGVVASYDYNNEGLLTQNVIVREEITIDFTYEDGTGNASLFSFNALEEESYINYLGLIPNVQ